MKIILSIFALSLLPIYAAEKELVCTEGRCCEREVNKEIHAPESEAVSKEASESTSK